KATAAWPAGFILILLIVLAAGCMKTIEETEIQVLRVPDNGIQPVVERDDHGTLHMIYFNGEPAAGNVFYRKKESGQDNFSEPVRVNSQSESVIAIGTVRGAHMSVTGDGRVHVAWMGSREAEPKGPGDAAPMLYTRLNETGNAFEEQRNIMQAAIGLDGGGTVAAGNDDMVYVVWHANPEKTGEEDRQVWMAKSADGGDTFDQEVAISNPETGVCGCCGIKATVDHAGEHAVIYRAATKLTGRDMYLLRSSGSGMSFSEQMLEPWKINACPMSTSSAFSEHDKFSVAWETNGQVSFASTKDATQQVDSLTRAPGDSRSRKHPAVAHNNREETILVWTEKMGWERGGTLHWQVFDVNLQPTSKSGRSDDVPVWSRPAVVTNENGDFTIFY
ncbi:MAG: hypothetical protein WD266_04760, partial [Balneolales bacterium]